MKSAILGTMLFCLVLATGSAVVAEEDSRFKITPDVVYGHKAGMALTFDVIRPQENPNNVGILFMVSGGWVSSWFPPEVIVQQQNKGPFNFFSALLDEGYTLFLVRHGSSPYFKVPEAVADVRRAVRYVRLHADEFNVDPDRLGVFGGSAGGHLSLMLGTTADDGKADADDEIERVSNRVAAVVAYYPPTKIDEFFHLDDRFPALDFDHGLADSVSPLLHVSEDDAPALIVHGDKDDLVPVNNGERIHEAFQKVNVPSKLVVIEGAGHSFVGDDGDRATKELVAWFNEQLLKPAK